MISLAQEKTLDQEEPVGQEAPEIPFVMPAPEGWRSETIPFPLNFAPELDYKGLEELRFAPGMFQEGSEEYWTYAFVWWLPSGTIVETKQLGLDLEAYFDGLIRTMAEANDFEVGDFKVLSDVRDIESPDGRDRRLRGMVRTLDPFVTREEVVLNMTVQIQECPENRVVFFELSPQPFSHAVWESLKQIREGFRCQK